MTTHHQIAIIPPLLCISFILCGSHLSSARPRIAFAAVKISLKVPSPRPLPTTPLIDGGFRHTRPRARDACLYCPRKKILLPFPLSHSSSKLVSFFSRRGVLPNRCFSALFVVTFDHFIQFPLVTPRILEN